MGESDRKSEKRNEWIKWIIASVVLPLAIAMIASGFFNEPEREIIYTEVPLIDDFEIFQYYPLIPGNIWTYSGREKIEYTSDSIVESTYVKTVTVADTTGFSNFIWVLMHDTKTYEDGRKESSEYGYVVASNKVYYAGSQVIIEGEIDLSDFTKLSAHIATMFEFPLFDGQQYGVDAPVQVLREDFRYRTVVQESLGRLSEQNNVIQEISSYDIINSVLGSDEVTVFVPYKGVIKYDYVHHGTIEEVHENLSSVNFN